MTSLRRTVRVLSRPGIKIFGKYAAADMRSNALIPGVVYGGSNKKSQLVCTAKSTIESMLRDRKESLENTLYTLVHEDGTEDGFVLPRQLQRDRVTDGLINMNFLRYSPEEGARILMPLEYKDADKCKGLKRGGELNKVHFHVWCYVKGDQIPDRVSVSLANLDVGGRIRWSDLDIPSNVRLVHVRDGLELTLCTMKGKASLKRAAEEESRNNSK